MKIESISFGNTDVTALLSGVSPFLGTISEVTAPSEDADLLIITVDGQTSIPFLEKTQLPEKPLKLFLVHTLIGAVIPFLKEADYIIYLGCNQKEIVEKLLDVSFRSEHSYFPGSTPVISEDRQDMFFYFPNPLSAEVEPSFVEFVKEARTSFDDATGTARLIMNVEDDMLEEFARFKEENCSGIECYRKQDISLEEIKNFVLNSKIGECFTLEMSSEQLKEYLEVIDTALLYIPQKADPIIEEVARCKVRVWSVFEGPMRQPLMDGHSFVSFENFAERIKNISGEVAAEIREEQKHRIDNTEVDTIDTINIAAGAPLTNDYVFSICFRNQEEKVIRAIDSICSQKGGIDCGIAIVDDCSTDRSTEKIIERLEGSGVDFVLVQNRKRRFASRNFYNVIHLLVDSEESVLIELDGDDFLVDDQVLIAVDEAYRDGALKTSGSFTVFPDMSSPVAKEIFTKHGAMDFSRPWSIVACNTWLPLRSAKMSILRQIEIDYFLERYNKQWLPDRHDAITQSRAIELAGPDRCRFIDKPLYVYDLSGADHDHGDHEEYDRTDHLIKLYRDLDRYYRGYSL